MAAAAMACFLTCTLMFMLAAATAAPADSSRSRSAASLDARLAWKVLDAARTFQDCFGAVDVSLWPPETALQCGRHSRSITNGSSCEGARTAVLLLAYDRPAYLERALSALLERHPLASASSRQRWRNALCAHSFEVFVSQDLQLVSAHSAEVSRVIERAKARAKVSGSVRVHHWVHDQQVDATVRTFPAVHAAYMRVSRHYFYALWRLFALRETHADSESESTVYHSACDLEITQRALHPFPRAPLPLETLLGDLSSCSEDASADPDRGAPFAFDDVIVLEDDLEIAPDFFEYFAALRTATAHDDSVFTISAWNDNGRAELAFDARTLHRTDFFPGLGWLLRRPLWDELQPKWPSMYWDDWMRAREQLRGRHSIRPEMSRTGNFGEHGVSRGLYFEQHITQVQLSSEYVPFRTSTDPDDAQLVGQIELHRYRTNFYSRLSHAVRLRAPSHVLKHAPHDADIVLEFNGFGALTKHLGLQGDERGGVRRGSFDGIVVFGYNRRFWGFAVPRNRSLLSAMPSWATVGRPQ
ncbi:Alpha-1,3-mannosyl-glycoprotein 2-beta-N-acetylglucosaminyltransferase [Porphyridium purpureum]|uniref:alpha-1,3-mannosyl-glycoprotein 2-beta-N-acetylglucosaminyltransferase n=1 Tax=Porphyridium purpureum TaxID=35688 RepID=A0A5J4YRT1_PORPP|nr:Alpha-1,3-mannosyl-glycoprotein 2-beta-N-acetylglucosaminyltransferase [Porphyridium purpureum]|eukprot:POR4794..scf296_7